MDYDAVLAASLGSCRKRPPSNVGEGHHQSTRRRESPLNLSLPCRRDVHKFLRVKPFHGVSAGNVPECLL